MKLSEVHDWASAVAYERFLGTPISDMCSAIERSGRRFERPGGPVYRDIKPDNTLSAHMPSAQPRPTLEALRAEVDAENARARRLEAEIASERQRNAELRERIELEREDGSAAIVRMALGGPGTKPSGSSDLVRSALDAAERSDTDTDTDTEARRDPHGSSDLVASILRRIGG